MERESCKKEEKARGGGRVIWATCSARKALAENHNHKKRAGKLAGISVILTRFFVSEIKSVRHDFEYVSESDPPARQSACRITQRRKCRM
jgi:hypothetical protein